MIAYVLCSVFMIYIQLCVVQECNLKFHITSIAEALLLYGIWYQVIR